MVPTNPLQIARGLTRHSSNNTTVANLRALGVQKRSITTANRCYRRVDILQS